MVKNTHGGSGHKKFARKSTNAGGSNNRIRTTECGYEKYAIVTKMCGNNIIHVYCLDNVARLCHIRGKFSGRRKRDNFVAVGTWVMIGLRDYDDNEENAIPAVASATPMPGATTRIKLKECDLLEVYTSVEKERLKDNADENWDILTSNDTSVLNRDSTKHHDEVRFTTDHDEDMENFIQTTASATAETIGNKDENINVDCI